MKTNRTIAILVTLIALLGIPLTAVAQSEMEVTTTHNAQLRSGPGAEFGSLAVVPFDATIPATGRNADESWVQVRYNGNVGWVSSSLLRWTGNLGALPVGGVVAAPAPQQVGGSGPVSATNANALNVRSAPDTTAALLGQLPAGSAIGLNGRWGSGERMWVRLDFDGQPAWIAGWLLSITGDATALPDIEAAQNVVMGLCVGGGAPEAAPYNGGPGVHPVLLLTNTGTRHAWGSQLGNWGVGGAPGSAQLIGCLSEERRAAIETCHYTGPDIVRYAYQIDVRLIVAQTGQVISSTTLSGNGPRACRQSEPWNLTVLEGSRVTLEQVRGWLQPFVNP